MDLFCGIDVGTSAVRVLICDAHGNVRSAAGRALDPVRGAHGRREQDARQWWDATRDALREAVAGVDAAAIAALAVDATSGTIVAVDRSLQPVSAGIMYNDGRATGYGARVTAAADAFVARHGYGFKDSFALPRMLWLRDHDAGFAATWKILHQSDFINAHLVGSVPATDTSNALKSGCDLFEGGWGAFIAAQLQFPMEKLPERVVAPATKIGEVCAAAARATGLKPGTVVVAGASDGTAALLASGACRPGDFNTTLGSTLVLKGITRELLHDPEGGVYSHRHPDGYWLPGGACNTGCRAIDLAFAPQAAGRRDVLQRLDTAAEAYLPCPVRTYPLGDVSEERFPFRKTGLTEFLSPPPTEPAEHYAAVLQGIAFVERWCYEKLEGLGAVVERVFSTGGGSRSRTWSRLRADVLGRTLQFPAEAETALGSAILAASHVVGNYESAAKSMVRVRECIEPGSRNFDEAYQAFRRECLERWGV